MLKKLIALGLVLACGSTVLADRGDRYRGFDRGDRYSSRSGFSIGFGFSSGHHRGNSSYIDIGYRSGYRGYDNFCETPRVYSPRYSYSYSSYSDCGPREVVVNRSYYRAPVYVERAPVIIERSPVYVEPAPVVVYPSYRYESCEPGGVYYRSSTSYYYGR